MKFIPTLALTPSHSFWAATFSLLLAISLVGAWLSWVYWKTSVDIQNAKNFAEVQITKERAFTARLEAAERALSPSPSESRPFGSTPFIDQGLSGAPKPRT